MFDENDAEIDGHDSLKCNTLRAEDLGECILVFCDRESGAGMCCLCRVGGSDC